MRGVIIRGVIMLGVIMLVVIMLGVLMPSVTAPSTPRVLLPNPKRMCSSYRESLLKGKEQYS
jgi:hypothetical protein